MHIKIITMVKYDFREEHFAKGYIGKNEIFSNITYSYIVFHIL